MLRSHFVILAIPPVSPLNSASLDLTKEKTAAFGISYVSEAVVSVFSFPFSLHLFGFSLGDSNHSLKNIHLYFALELCMFLLIVILDGLMAKDVYVGFYICILICLFPLFISTIEVFRIYLSTVDAEVLK